MSEKRKEETHFYLLTQILPFQNKTKLIKRIKRGKNNGLRIESDTINPNGKFYSAKDEAKHLFVLAGCG